ncbi:MAG: right-handed parallel beta-helix repeat-containing protein [Planctomycetota bacterium]
METRSRATWVRIGILLSVAILGADRARAGDWYVDAANGSDVNDGLTPATAWRTLTHAMGAIPSQPPLVLETIHMAGGVYDAQLGEVYPVAARPLTRIVGAPLSPRPILDGGGAQSILAYWPDPNTSVDGSTGADSLTLRNAVSGLVVSASNGEVSPSFSDLLIRDTTGPGVAVEASAAMFTTAHARATFERLDIAGCAEGVHVQSSAGHLESAVGEVVLTDCTVRGSALDGVRLTATGNGSAYATLERCRILSNGRHGTWAWINGGYNTAHVTAKASLIAGNQECGLLVESVGASGGGVTLTDSTVAGNGQAGVRGISAQLRNCVVAGNGDDLDLWQGNLWARYTISGDGDLAGFPRCLTGDPLFVDPGAGDFRLRFESPCIDIGDPAAAGRSDLFGHVRPYDGDLDTVPAPDFGAFEFEPLHHFGTPHVGRRMHFELWGPPGSQARLWFNRLPLAAPSTTPFGSLYLESSGYAELGPYAIGGSPPLRLDLRVPNDPNLVGTTYSFQSLTSSSGAPQGWALSNPITFVIAP